MNKVMLIGNVGRDPEVRYFDTDQAVANVRLATTEKGYTLQNGTRVPDRTDWHTLVFSRRLAKVVESYVHKGDKIYVEGRLMYRQYDDKRGIQRISAEIQVDSIELLTPRTVSSQPAAQPIDTQSAHTASQQTKGDDQTKSSAVDSDDKIVPF